MKQTKLLTLLLALSKSSGTIVVTVTCPTQHSVPGGFWINSQEETQLQNFITIKPNYFDRIVFKGNILYIQYSCGSKWIWVPWTLGQSLLEILSMLSHTTSQITSSRNSITKFRQRWKKWHGTYWHYVSLSYLEQTRFVYHSCVISRETEPLVYLLPVPSCLVGFWAVLSFEADWLSAQPMSSLRPCTSLYTSIGWRL